MNSSHIFVTTNSFVTPELCHIFVTLRAALTLFLHSDSVELESVVSVDVVVVVLLSVVHSLELELDEETAGTGFLTG